MKEIESGAYVAIKSHFDNKFAQRFILFESFLKWVILTKNSCFSPSKSSRRGSRTNLTE